MSGRKGDRYSESEKECFVKAIDRGQHTFTLVGQDLSSPEVVCEWIKQNIKTAPVGKLKDALEIAMIMRSEGLKYAD